MKTRVTTTILAVLCAGAAFGQSGTVIGGLEWANTNVAQPNTFAPRADMYTELYQWNRLTAWSITGSVSGWHSANYDESPTWTVNPCPEGWRLPTPAAFRALSNAGSTWANAGTRGNAVNGRFYGANHATCTLPNNMNSCIFLPAVGSRFNSGEVNGHTRCGMYWTSRQSSVFNGFMLHFDDSKSPVSSNSKGRGVPIRCVGAYTIIGGVKWANTNVDDYQTFAVRPDMPDMYAKLYQFNRTKAWSTSNAFFLWPAPIDENMNWHVDSSPCPAGWRLPTRAEFFALDSVSGGYNDITKGGTWADADTRGNAVAGRFYGVNHAACTLPNNMENCVFFPAVGYRFSVSLDINNEEFYSIYIHGDYSFYWSATERDSKNGYSLTFFKESATSNPNGGNDKANGLSVRCVQDVQ